MPAMRFCTGGGAPFFPDVLHAWQGKEDAPGDEGPLGIEDLPGAGQLYLDLFSVGDWREWIFQMCYHQHGGSGTNFTLQDVLNMPVDDFGWYLNFLFVQRHNEGVQIEKAMAVR